MQIPQKSVLLRAALLFVAGFALACILLPLDLGMNPWIGDSVDRPWHEFILSRHFFTFLYAKYSWYACVVVAAVIVVGGLFIHFSGSRNSR